MYCVTQWATLQLPFSVFFSFFLLFRFTLEMFGRVASTEDGSEGTERWVGLDA